MDGKANTSGTKHNPNSSCLMNDTIRKRLLNVLDYIEAVENLDARIPFRVADHQRPLYFEHQITGLPGINLGPIAANQQSWLEIKRLQPRDPPLPENETLRDLVRLQNDPSKEPVLNLEALKLENDETGEKPIDVDWLKQAFKDYLDGPYRKWKEEEAPRRETINLYAALFGLKRAIDVDSASDPIELVWGIGVALWQTQGKKLEYPILLQGVEIHINDQTMSMSVIPRETDTIVELSAFSALQNVGTSAARQSVNEFFEGLSRPLSPFDRESFSGALHHCISILDSTGFLWEKNKQEPPAFSLPEAISRLMITDTWVLFVRPKSAHFLLQDLERLKQAVKESDDLPPGPHALFKDPSKEPRAFTRIPFRGISSPNPNPMEGRRPEDLFFPKPYNSEQVQIAERLDQAPGVVAQGPPGTGKTHTIANIICHYLANNRSVLVTSKSEQALRVLKDKLPDGIKPLAVSLLASDREALQEMEQAVNNILQRLTRIDRDPLRKDIEADRKQIDVLCAAIARTQNEIHSWAHKQLKEITFNGRSLMPDELAKAIVRDSEKHSWLPSPVIWTDKAFDIDEKDIQELRELRCKLRHRIICHGWSLPEISELPSVNHYSDLHQALTKKRSLTREAEVNGLPVSRRDYSQNSLKHAQQLLRVLLLAQKVAGYKYSAEYHWLDHLVQEVRKKLENQESIGVANQLELIFKEVLNLEKERTELLGNPVAFPEEGFTDSDFIAAINRLSNGLPAFGAFAGFAKGRQKKWLKEVRLLGREPCDQQEWNWVSRHIKQRQAFHSIAIRWNSLILEVNGPVFEPSDLEKIKSIISEARKGQEALLFCTKGQSFIKQVMHIVFPSFDSKVSIIDNPEAISRYISALENHLFQGNLNTAIEKVESLKRLLSQHKNHLSDKFIHEVECNLGQSTVDQDELLKRWAQLLEELSLLHSLQPQFAKLKELAAKISQAGAKPWAEALMSEPASEQIDPLLPGNYKEGVEWHRLMNYLESIDGQYRLQELAEELRNAEKRLTQTQERLVENLTWLGMTNISEEHQRALRQYSIAVIHIGAGTGTVRTPRYRREAREAMKKAVGAVPCWIMPHWRISEALPAEIGRFDLVIIDEASQSDIWALPALLRGKKILVVGDEKQVSPSLIGKTEAALSNLSQQYLKGFDLGKQMGPESSIYDLAQVAFAADNICLREHFRCTEPIIAFSDRHWYHCLVPLRIPKASERIDPPLIDVYVKDGNRNDRNKTNVPEAHAIVQEIKELTSNARFAGRSIGVISLLGQGAQAKYIAEQLFNTIGEEKIKEHDIVCGDPSTFQGNEKDIIFLSMVDDRNHLHPRTDRASAQRFNVAASRARDRMYLFRSFSREDIKNPKDLRAALLDHFRNPLAQGQQKVESLRNLCESEFEERVYDSLVSRGFRVTPQVPAGGYRIDLVIEGTENRRLAIECDGSRFHGPERYFDDLNRQRVLERVGWTFWRCWGATFYREPERVLTNLYENLEEMGISPIGAVTEALTGYTEYREVCGLPDQRQNGKGQTEEPKTVTDTIPIVGETGGKKAETGKKIEGGVRREPIILYRQTQRPQISKIRAGPKISSQVRFTFPATPHETNHENQVDKKQKARVRGEDSVTYCFIENEKEVKTVQIVAGPNQPSMGIININSPLGKALLGAEVGDEVELRLPTGIKIARVLKIE